MSAVTQLLALTQQVGRDIATIRRMLNGNTDDLSGLAVPGATNLVEAINTVYSRPGRQGPPGNPGTPGNNGSDSSVPGPQGIPGVQGIQGPVGPRGAIGPAGITWQGVWNSTTVYGQDDAVYYDDGAGTAGSWLAAEPPTPGDVPGTATTWVPLALRGPVGPTGPQGAQGPAGADSTVPGPAGPQGPAGTNGSNGQKGDTGAQGSTGPTGQTGPQGATGATGPTGPTGATGAVGAAGANGAQGPAGPGVPAGGAISAMLVKSSSTDYATKWLGPVDGTLTYASNFAAFNYYNSFIRQYPGGQVVTGISVYKNANIAAGDASFTLSGVPVPAGNPQPFVVGLYNSGNSTWGGFAVCQIGTNGALTVLYVSGTGNCLCGVMTYRP